MEVSYGFRELGCIAFLQAQQIDFEILGQLNEFIARMVLPEVVTDDS